MKKILLFLSIGYLSIQFSSAQFAIIKTQTNATCVGDSNGTAKVSVSRRTPPYTYSWSKDGSTDVIGISDSLSGLTAGSYNCNITDVEGFQTTISFTITYKSRIISTTGGFGCETILPSCSSSNTGSACIQVWQGIPPYTYSWNTTPIQTTETAINLSEGYYTYSITDSLGCSDTNSFYLPSAIPNFNLSFAASPQTGVSPLAVAFNNNTPNIDNYTFKWFFGDGNSIDDSSSTVFHTYQYSGSYDIALIAIDKNTGCSDTLLKNGFIYTTGAGCTHSATITTLSSTTACQGDTIILSANIDTSFTYKWNINGTAIDGETNNILKATQTGYYSVTVLKDNCPVTSNATPVTFKNGPPIPTITSVGTIEPCIGGAVTLSVMPIYGINYLWNTGDTTNSITTHNTGIYSVSLVDTISGCSKMSDIYRLSTTLSIQDICMVTSNDSSTHNIIIWEKPISTNIDSFIIYREVVTNVYNKIASINYNSLSEYHDYDANPNVTSYKYKIEVIDTCGSVSQLSNFHNSIHLQNLGNGNFQWTLYNIENSINPIQYYIMYRDNYRNGSFLPISSTIPSGNSTYTDLEYSMYPDAKYRVAALWNISCIPTKKTNEIPPNTTYSNIKNQESIPTGISFNNIDLSISAYPNPTNNIVNIEGLGQIKKGSIQIINITGQILYTEHISSTPNIKQIDISSYYNGFYTIVIENHGIKTYKKIKK